MNFKTMLMGGGAMLVFVASIFVVGCQKEQMQDNLNGVSGKSQRNAAPASVQTVPATQKAYIASYTNSYLSTINYFDANNGSNFTLVVGLGSLMNPVHVTGIAWNSANCIQYFATGTSADGYSKLSKLNTDGTVTTIGDIQYGSSPLYVSEMEFDASGNLWILTGNGSSSVELYQVASSQLGNSTITATRINALFSITRAVTHQASISYNTNTGKLHIVYESSNNSTDTKSADITVSGTTITWGTVDTKTIYSPNSGDFGTYYYSGTLYFAKNGNLYSWGSSSGSSLTMSTTNDFTYWGNCNP